MRDSPDRESEREHKSKKNAWNEMNAAVANKSKSKENNANNNNHYAIHKYTHIKGIQKNHRMHNQCTRFSWSRFGRSSFAAIIVAVVICYICFRWTMNRFDSTIEQSKAKQRRKQTFENISKCINYADEVIWNLTYINVTQTNAKIKRREKVASS